MRIVDIQLGFPAILVALILLAVLGKGVDKIIIALVTVQWAYYARTARSAALVERSKEYIEAARALGLGAGRIVLRAGVDANASVRTLVHELAHALVRSERREGDPALAYEQEELVVESVTLTVCQQTGLDTLASSRPMIWPALTLSPGCTRLGTSSLKPCIRVMVTFEGMPACVNPSCGGASKFLNR